MTDQIVSPEELAKRQQALYDAASMGPYIPDELKAQLEAGLSEEMRTAVLQLQILSIKYGRALERRNLAARRIVIEPSSKPSNLVGKLLDRAGVPMQPTSKEVQVPESKDKPNILVVPGHVSLKHRSEH